MKAFIAFTKKEFFESMRTYRLIVLTAVMILLGIMNPLIAKLLPEILGGVDLGGGIVIDLPEPTALDSWTQFYSNVGQMGMLALIITFSGIMANELSRGTLVNLLTKGLKRYKIILAKFLSASVIWTGTYLLCLLVCYMYTEYFWPSSELSNAFLAFVSPWLFGELMIAILIFGGVLFGTFYGALLSCFGVIMALAIINIAPSIQKYNPIGLAGGVLGLLYGQSEPQDFIPAVIISIAAVVLLIIASVAVFNKKKV